MKKILILFCCIGLSHLLMAQDPIPRSPSEKSIFSYKDSLNNVLERTDAWGDTILLGNSKKGTPIYAYYYNRGGTDSALIMAGVHGSEFLGVDVADKTKEWLDGKINDKTTFKWKVIVLPSLFTDRVKVAAKDSLRTDNYMRCACNHEICNKYITVNGCIDPNRQMPRAGNMFIPRNNESEESKSKIGTKIEIENQYLLQLVQVYNPSLVVSVHCKNEGLKEEIGIYADPKTDEKNIALGFADDAALAIKMAFTVQENKGRVLGNFYLKNESKSKTFADSIRAIYPQDDHAAKKDSVQKRSYQKNSGLDGVSFGTWASTQIKTNGVLVKQAATTITVEMPQYYSFFTNNTFSPAQRNQNLANNIKAYTAAITDVFLSNQ